jgi:hypothetical protein
VASAVHQATYVSLWSLVDATPTRTTYTQSCLARETQRVVATRWRSWSREAKSTRGL